MTQGEHGTSFYPVGGMVTSDGHVTGQYQMQEEARYAGNAPHAVAPWCEPPVPLSTRASHQWVLIVDDSAIVRKILEISLRRVGYAQVRSFPDGIELLRWLITPEACIPALVIVDLMMPKMDGYDLMRRLKAKPAFAWTVFVILSGRAGVLDKLKGRLSGASVYLTKPFKTQDIVAVVEAYVGSAPLPVPSACERG